MKVDDAFHGISTLIISSIPEGNSQGTAFFYQELGQKDPDKDGQWVKIENVWLVTNRHAVLPKINGKEVVPESFSFHLRKLSNDKLVWEPVVIQKAELLNRMKLHQDDNVDVCVIHVLDLLEERLQSGEQYLQWYGVSSDHLPGNNKIQMEVADDVVVIGYPRGFYDHTNLYPIVKSGIIASRWGFNFNGLPYFLIDAKLFPGSSGSIVVSKPQNITVDGGMVFCAKEKQFTFLGIYSGELIRQPHPIEMDDITIIRKEGFNLGTVWYGSLVDEIIRDGKPYEIVK